MELPTPKEPKMTFYIATDPSTDLHAAGERNTDAARAAFASAFERAAAMVSRAAGIDIEVHLGDSADYSPSFRHGLHEQDGDLSDLLWQSLHDAVVQGSRPGRWKVNKTSAASTGAWLRRKAAR